ncbi:DNA repair protein RecO [Nostoc linckia z18]|uniref:DNA repair protein RecO n=2 Tax=Nostoc linckia TaxID=92942 RepID=A0A9Q5ZEG7_NOSLI|nr:DNA repair protein RecO [Nostoc linckia]PHK33699.1 DNA repair protein RecO [Nostoc linckia z15]PHK47770.1 DNA repair protein RecO [Nostoc linckia z16]PHJ65988.1 DNA repair protein RecO [Nostoc linckia z1]PHJ68894.1 DNA repair protein RecO [Nostoc linckia z3]PHJ74545.1 DNA repair protein RecO [Nostoc linckia z2]
MSRTYKATGINLKTQALGESDKIVTILTPEFGLVRAVAPGARKHNSSLGGRSGMFVVNELLIAKGRSLDKITQAQTLKTYPGLAKDLGKLAASQYLAEIVLCQALSEQPQEELYELFNEHLHRLEVLPSGNTSGVLAHLAHGVFHLLALAGLTPQVQICCLSGRPLTPDFTDPNWQVGFSTPAGGTVCLETWESLRTEREREMRENNKQYPMPHAPSAISNAQTVVVHRQEIPMISSRPGAMELALLQHLSQPEILHIDGASHRNWLSVEQILRQYTQYQLGRPIRSANLIDSYFAANHDAIV